LAAVADPAHLRGGADGYRGLSAFAFERLPHLEDEVAYLFQARTMAMGRLTVPSPAQPDSFWTPFVLD